MFFYKIFIFGPFSYSLWILVLFGNSRVYCKHFGILLLKIVQKLKFSQIFLQKKNIENAIFCPTAKNGWNSKLIHGLGLEFITEPIENMKCMKKMWLQCCLWLLNIVNFLNFATLRPYISKTWGHAKNFIFCSTSSKSAQKCIGIKKDYNFFYYLTPITKFCPLAKDCRDPKFIPNFFIVFFFLFIV